MVKTAIRYCRHTRFIKRLILRMLLLISLTCTSAEAVSITPLSMIGTVEVLSEGNQQWVTFQEGMELQAGDRIRTGEGGEIDLWCEDGSELHLGVGTQLAIDTLEFNEKSRQRIFRFRLIQGTLSAHAIQIGSTDSGFTITEQSLMSLRNQNVPETVISRLTALKGQEFATEDEFFEAARSKLDGPLIVRYAVYLLQYAGTREDVFEIHTENAIMKSVADMPSSLTVSVGHEPLYSQVFVRLGRLTIHRVDDKGQIRVVGLTDIQEGEGFQFLLDRSDGQAWIAKKDNRLSVRSTVPLSNFQALFGKNYGVVSITNNLDSPSFVVNHLDAAVAELEGDEGALFAIPPEQYLSIEFSDITHCTFEFRKQFSSLVITQKGCPVLNGEETCCGYVSKELPLIGSSGEIEEFRTEERTIPPAPESPNPQGSFASDSSPEKPGSPIQPLP